MRSSTSAQTLSGMRATTASTDSSTWSGESAPAKIVVNSRGVQEFYVEHGLPADKFRLIPNGIGPSAASTVSREELLAELNLPPNAKLMGAVGRLWPQKRIKDFTPDIIAVSTSMAILAKPAPRGPELAVVLQTACLFGIG